MSSGSARRSGRGGGDRRTTRSHPRRSRADVGPYVAFLLMWAFATFVFSLAVPDAWVVISVAMITVFIMYVTWCTAAAYLGRKLAAWQKGLVRLPLIAVGAGKERVDQVKGQGRARAAVALLALVSAVLLAATAWLAVNA